MDGIDGCEIEIVWEPMWNPRMISAEGRRLLGMEEPEDEDEE